MMEAPRITLLESQCSALKGFLEGHPEGHERAAVVLFRRLCCEVEGLASSDRYLAVEVIPFADEWVTSSSEMHVGFNLGNLRELFRRCDDEGLVFGFVHNHPVGLKEFSDIDDRNERALLQAISNRNGRSVHLVSLLLSDDQWFGRVRHAEHPDEVQSVRHIAVIGDRVKLYDYSDVAGVQEEFSSRQSAAFGAPFVGAVRSLRVGVIGASGTGSPTATLLARAGVGELLIFDKDRLESSNLNRVRGAKMRDVAINKAVVLRDFINDLGLPCRAACIESYVDASGETVDALASCDVVFGCTDDYIGRQCATAALYAYLQVNIDVGLGGYIVQDAEGHAMLRGHHGRVSLTMPEFGECLFCQGIISDKLIQYQYATRENPLLTAEEARERYLENGGEGAPGVGPFTSAVADFSVATFFDLVRPFRRLPESLRRDQLCINFVSLEFSSPEPRNNAECEYCGQHTFLLLASKTRLKRPALGKRTINV